MMEDLHRRVSDLRKRYQALYQQFSIDDERRALMQLEMELARPEIWHNPTRATDLNKQCAAQQAVVQPWLALDMQLQGMTELMALGDESMLPEFDNQLRAMKESLDELIKPL